jgi:hypothetical protein
MTLLDELIAQIPIRHNLISYLVFSGVLLGFLLPILIWVRASRSNRALRYYAFLLYRFFILPLKWVHPFFGLKPTPTSSKDKTVPVSRP